MMNRVIAGAVLAVVGAGLLAGAGPTEGVRARREQPAGPGAGPRVSAPRVEAGVEFRVISVNATTAVTFAEPGKDGPGGGARVEGQLQVMGRFTLEGAGQEKGEGGGGFKTASGKPVRGEAAADGPPPGVVLYPWRMVITSALDDRERELVNPKGIDRRDQQWNRQALGQHFQQALGNSQNDYHLVQDSLRGLKVRPERVSSIRGRAEAVVGKRIIRMPIELKAMEEGVQVAPGVVVLITEVSAAERRSVVDFEVRTRRNREGEGAGPGYEPVFAGLALKDERGEVVVLLRHGQEVEARDEYLFLAKEQGMPKEVLERVRGAEVWVVDEVRPLVMEFEVTGLGAGG